MRIILASGSPRRRELLSHIVKDFEIITRDTDETLPENMHPSKGVEVIAIRKGRAVADVLDPDCLVISSDTLVELDGVPLGKPVDGDDAVRMLLTLSEKVHHVHTGVAVHYNGCVYSGVDSSEVKFGRISREDALWYVSTGEPLDKAGSYAIQGIGKKFIEGFKGDYNAIIGLGLELTQRLILEATSGDKE